MDNKLEQGENFRVQGSLDSDAVSKNSREEDLSGELLKENQKDFILNTPSGLNPNNNRKDKTETEKKKGTTEIGNGASVSNP